MAVAGWILSAVLAVGWFIYFLISGFAFLTMKETIKAVCNEAGINSKAVLKEIGLKDK